MLPLGVSFWDGAGWGLQPGGRGACLSFRPEGVFGSLVEKAGWSVGCSLRGASCMLLPFSAWGPDPPWCSTDPASPTAALQKGLCWGVCRLYPGLRGCVRRGKRRKGAESCCLLLKRLERCEGTRKKARHGERGGTAAPVVVLLPSPALQGLGWAVNVEGAVRGGAIEKRGWW